MSKMTKLFSIRFALAFLIAPISPGIVAYLVSLAVDEVTYTGLIFGITTILGYGFTIFLGLPFYYFYIKTDSVSYLNMLGFAFLCTAIVELFMVAGSLSIQEYDQILSSSHLGYLLIFFMSALIASTVFYFIMNFKQA